MLKRAAWAAGNAALWVLSCGAATVIVLHPDSIVRAIALMVALGAFTAWIAHTLTDHYAELIDEHERFSHTRDVVFGATEEADRTLVDRTRAAQRALARRQRRQRPLEPPAAPVPTWTPEGWADVVPHRR